MNVKKLTVLMLAVAVITACSGDKEDPGVPVAIQFAGEIGVNEVTPANRASNSQWAAGDVIGVYMFENGTNTIKNGFENISHTTATGNGIFTRTNGETIYYPEDKTEKADFMAYYPYNPGLTGYIYQVDVSNQSQPTAIDLLYAKTAIDNPQGYSRSNPEVNLKFEHKLSKLVLITQPGQGITSLSGLTISINGMNTQATFNLETGVLSSGTVPAVLVPFTMADGARYEAIILPGTIPAGDEWIVQFSLNNDVYEWSIPDEIQFQSGYEYTWTVAVNKTPVSVSGSIREWSVYNGGPVDAY